MFCQSLPPFPPLRPQTIKFNRKKKKEKANIAMVYAPIQSTNQARCKKKKHWV
jgi:hypothetical protein